MSNVLVVGGAGGIGSAIVSAFEAKGDIVIVGDIDETRGTQICSVEKPNLLYALVDVTNTDSLLSFADRIDRQVGHIDHFVSLAGGALIEEFDGLEGSSMQVIAESIDINLKSHIFLTKILLPFLEKSASSNKTITFISSINAIKDYGLPAYSASKAGLMGLVRSLAGELGEKDIRVNAILPGTTITERTSEEPKNFSEYLKGSVLGRLSTVNEIASVVYSLTEMMTCITGQCIVADCGQSIKGYM